MPNCENGSRAMSVEVGKVEKVAVDTLPSGP